MSRKTFYELIEDIGINPSTELKRIEQLFALDGAVEWNGYYLPLQAYIGLRYFRNFDFRGTYTDINELTRAILGEEENDKISFDSLFTYFEFLLAVFMDTEVSRDYMIKDNGQATTIIKNIFTILEKTNHQISNIGNEEKKKYIIVEKNKMATQAVELLNDEHITTEIIEYNRYSLKGDLAGKRKILISIGNYLEPLFKSGKLQNTCYKQLESDAGFLLNCFHIRHNNKEGKKAQDYIVSLSDELLEEWYDKAYNTLLSVIIASEEIDISKELNVLKKEYNWKR